MPKTSLLRIAADEARNASRSKQRLQGQENRLARQRHADRDRKPLAGNPNKTLTRPGYSVAAACARRLGCPPESRSSKRGLDALPGRELHVLS